MKYYFNEIEAKWQKFWSENQTFRAENESDKEKFYVLDMFPYPSGAGLHVGHPLGYIASDIYARYKRHKGFNVLHPQGYDSFGLPAEQYAIQTGQHPAKTTKENIETYRRQLDQIGFSFDWSREVRTSDPSYYKWTQWIFIQLFNSYYSLDDNKAKDIRELEEIFEIEGNVKVKAACDEKVDSFGAEEWNGFTRKKKDRILSQYRLTYLSDTEVNWCPELGTVLANDEIVNGVSERGGFPVIRKKMKQWSMRITAYAQRLLDGLDTIDWPQPLKDSQTNWIGRSEGAMVDFKVEGHDALIEVFTTRPDTIFGVSFMTLAPEHELVERITTPDQKTAVEDYVLSASKKSERDRMSDVKSISGVFTGAYAIHPFSGEQIPIWIGDYVLASYGTGAVMAVPCGDQRDYDFAKYFGIDIPNIFKDIDISEGACEDKNAEIANSDFISGLGVKEAISKVISELENRGIGQGKINYRLRDAVFSRQRYWGEPFPVYYKDGVPQMIDEQYLPITLPEVEKYLPTSDGKPPLGNATVWAWDTDKNTIVSNELIDEENIFPLELNTMPGWAGSSWYFNRYMDARNDNEFCGRSAISYWKDVDLYIGGSEHATGHLLYSRFWQKFLFDRGFVPVEEYAKKLINQGMILGTSAFVYRKEGENIFISKGLVKDEKVQPIHVDVSLVNASNELDLEAFKKNTFHKDVKDAQFILEDGKYIVGREVEKMSKSKYNVVNPDDICRDYGADTLRMYEMFLGPLEQAKPWNTAGITGVHGFLKRFWKLFHASGDFSVSDVAPNHEELKVLHKTIKKVDEDIANFSFNTSVSSFMIAVNELTALKCSKRDILEPLTILISPYAPHIAEELWSKLGHKDSISTAVYPEFESKYLVESTKTYPISFNGKMRFTKELPLELDKAAIEKAVLEDERTLKQLDGRTPKKVIVVPGKIVNIVG
ncbi:leucine--tRNA ligase [Lutimonas zeaxanthinifaciens]|uniref:leucine--tRNA ligase n=1 Tax=Lutimonas zeaxanthinifaciens TaxID=3060215 RepID=UPI00265D201F|nr:leucine--tRNA ligase [Lutimonas sp. YSD2104]WKK66392.1 leucine--tRNA ligase [Lutimonas sp. YSD2104]